MPPCSTLRAQRRDCDDTCRSKRRIGEWTIFTRGASRLKLLPHAERRRAVARPRAAKLIACKRCRRYIVTRSSTWRLCIRWPQPRALRTCASGTAMHRLGPESARSCGASIFPRSGRLQSAAGEICGRHVMSRDSSTSIVSREVHRQTLAAPSSEAEQPEPFSAGTSWHSHGLPTACIWRQ